MKKLPLTEAECDGKTYYYIDNGKNYNKEMPDCLFLAGFDQLMLGYEKKESLYLPQEHLRKIFNLAGIVMPALMINGQIAGKWKLKNGKLTVEVFDKISEKEQKVIKEKAEILGNDLKTIEIL